MPIAKAPLQNQRTIPSEYTPEQCNIIFAQTNRYAAEKPNIL